MHSHWELILIYYVLTSSKYLKCWPNNYITRFAIHSTTSNNPSRTILWLTLKSMRTLRPFNDCYDNPQFECNIGNRLVITVYLYRCNWIVWLRLDWIPSLDRYRSYNIWSLQKFLICLLQYYLDVCLRDFDSFVGNWKLYKSHKS